MQVTRFKAAFTLLEILIVVIIIAVIVAIAFSQYLKTVERSKVHSEAIPNLRIIRTAQKIYFMENYTFADTIDKLNIEDPNISSSYFTYSIRSAAETGVPLTTDFTARAQTKSGAYSSYYYEISKSGVITSNGSPLL